MFMNDRSLRGKKKLLLNRLKKDIPPMVLVVEWVFYLFMKNAHLAVKEQQKKSFLINSFEHLVDSNREFIKETFLTLHEWLG